jgi:hypothetical protein
MTKNLLTEKQKKELEKLSLAIRLEAKSVVKDYTDNPSEMSGSVISIHEDSPFMSEMYKDDSWKHVIHGSIKEGIEAVKKLKKDKKNT